MVLRVGRRPAPVGRNDEVAVDRCRARLRPDAGRQTGIHAARIRQEQRARARGTAAAGATKRLTDDVYAKRPAVPRDRREWQQLSG